MMLLRAVQHADLSGLMQLALQAGAGLTNLPADESILQQRIARSLQSFAQPMGQDFYFFVLEVDQQIVGTSAIETGVGITAPFYSYRLSQVPHVSETLSIHKNLQTLNLVSDLQNVSEICALYLHPEYRGQHRGTCLSKGRFLYMAMFPERFNEKVIADLRGVSDANGYAPFWQALGGHFFEMDFSEADYLTVQGSKQFIADLMPKHPIYVALLDETAQKVIGQPHVNTQPAKQMLEREGFRFNQYVDIFDAGPTLEVDKASIETIKHSQVGQVKTLTSALHSSRYLVATEKTDFRAGVCSLLCDDEHSVTIDTKTSKLLQLQVGDTVRFIKLS